VYSSVQYTGRSSPILCAVEGLRMLSVITSDFLADLPRYLLGICLETRFLLLNVLGVGDYEQVISKVHIFNTCKDVKQESQYHTALPHSSFQFETVVASSHFAC